MQLTKRQRSALLRQVWLFEQCSSRELAQLESVLTEVAVPIGRELACQGADGREFIVLVEGKADVTRDGTHLATLGAGDFFGELSLLDKQPRTATVTTVEPSRVLVMTAPAFNALVRTISSVDHKMLVVLARRLREIEARYVPSHERTSSANIA
jgi:CRP-like cAMP-binding protein